MTDQLHQDFPTELKREIDAITCEGCGRNEPIIIHDGTPISMAALKGKVFHTSGQCTSKADKLLPLFDSIAAKAFEMAAQAVERHAAGYPINLCNLASAIRALTPASLLREQRETVCAKHHVHLCKICFPVPPDIRDQIVGECSKAIAKVEAERDKILRDAERSKLEARLEERQNQPDCGCFQYVGKAQRKCNRCIELESQIAALSSPVGEDAK